MLLGKNSLLQKLYYNSAWEHFHNTNSRLAQFLECKILYRYNYLLLR